MDISIGICLATYNGATYLEEQLESLLAQTYKEFVVYIHDDSSSDNTVEIIKKYVSKYPEKIVFFDDDISYKDAGLNFIETLKKMPEHDFYMFCDQDDVWLEDKISLTLNTILEHTKKMNQYPILCHTDLKVVDENLKTIKDSFSRAMRINFENTDYSYYVVAGNNVTGCTAMFNHCARELMQEYTYPEADKKMVHDYWLVLCVSSRSNGVVLFLDKATILYRQHSNNTIGFSHNKKKSSKYPLLKTFLNMLDVNYIIKAFKKAKLSKKFYPKKVSVFKYLQIRFISKYQQNKYDM